MIRTVLHILDSLILHYSLQLIFRLTPLTLAAKSNEKFISQSKIEKEKVEDEYVDAKATKADNAKVPEHL